MANKIRGPADDSTQMVLGQINKVFDPEWLQTFDTGRFLIEFQSEPDSLEALERFAEMYGYELDSERDHVWKGYYFSRSD